MAKKILFLLVVFFTNIIQGITGFAGTMLAMPPSVMLVGFDTAKPILNALGLLSGIYIVAANRKSVNKKNFENSRRYDRRYARGLRSAQCA